MYEALVSVVNEMQLEILGDSPAGIAVFPQWMGVPLSIAVFVGIVFAYKGYGMTGLSILMTYISALIAVQLTMKRVLADFAYPVFMSTTHWLFSFTATSICLKVREEKFPEVDFKDEQFRDYFLHLVLPLSICQVCSIAMNNISLLYIGAGVNSMISLATPIFTTLLASFFGMKISTVAWVAIILTVAGDAIITMDGFRVTVAEGQSIHLFMIGISLSVIALGSRASKNVLCDKLMSKYGEDDHQKKYTPLQAWFLQVPGMIILGLVGGLLFEGLAPWKALPAALASPLVFMIMLNIASAMYLNIIGMFVVKMLGAPAAQIAGKLNVLVVVALSCALLGETITLVQGASTLFIIGGAMLFEKAQSKSINDLQGLLDAFQGEKYDEKM